MEKDLRQRFNPDGSQLRNLQLKMLDLLKFIDSVCKKHQIKYWLSSGTLLGAARHKGFIPWDDDLDIEMMREDYLRLLKVISGELPSNYVLQTHETDKNYIFNFAKLRDESTFLAETNNYDRVFKYRGVFIDIFPMEKIPYSLAWIASHMQGRIYRQLKRKGTSDEIINKNNRRIYAFNHSIGFPILRIVAKFFLPNKIRHSFGTAYFSPRYSEDIFPLGKIEFEGQLFPAPQSPHDYLTKIYGDYMKLPDLNAVSSHFKEIRLEE